MSLFSHLKISTKIIVLATILAGVLLGTTLFFIITDIRKVSVNSILEASQEDTETHAGTINTLLENIQNTVIALSKTPPIQGLFRAEINGDFDEVENSSSDEWRGRLGVIFSSFIASTDLYDQLRYINESGKEVVRVNNNEDFAEIIPKENLQDKSDRPYFIETSKLNKGELYVSRPSLNREGSPPKIATPYNPVIRYAVPVFDDRGDRKGILIANVLLGRLLDKADIHDKVGENFLIIDQDGNYLSHQDKKKEWGGVEDLNTGENFNNDFPSFATDVLENPSGLNFDGQNIFSYTKVFLSNSNELLFFVIFKNTLATTVFAPINRLIIQDSLIGVLAFIFLFVLFFFTINKTLQPLKTLATGAKRIGEGHFDQPVLIHSNDEIGIVAKAFNAMMKRLKDFYTDLETKIAQKTKELSLKVSELEKAEKEILNILEKVEKEKESVSQERDRITTILQSIGDGVFVLDKNLKIVLLNQVTENLSGFTKEEAEGIDYGSILRFEYEKDGTINNAFIKKAIQTGEVQEMTNHTVLVRKDNTKIHVSNSAAPLKDKDGNVVGVVIVFHNVSKEREIDRAKTEFVSLASHQLRTPLTSISWYAEMLLSGDAGRLNKTQKEFLNEIHNGNQRMVDLVNALLNVSRIDMGTFAIDPEPTNFIEIADSVLVELLPQTKGKKMNIKKDYANNLPLIEADKKLVRIIFQNLISNAVKYTPAKGDVIVTIKKEKQDVFIAISDTGYGIPKSQQSKIFQKLFRADNVREKDTNGTGLGLYVVKSIINEGGGKIWFESEENKGTTFYVTLPLSGMKLKKGEKGLKS